ncbi:rRNA maturation RNase YbeY [Armatimonas rosea]|uniref:Endoribonuclease YbeY n=1 Tax=Armatimonas rosea TaxID=685828 RepID=A0A7W9SU13_ARMRO|nr:rRNA maturation RNase YbeY [Armatimonas rosea]MBB6052656.1 putative rRNA maturation factor [Armatimonas rosea]
MILAEILVQNQHPNPTLPWERAAAAAQRLLSECLSSPPRPTGEPFEVSVVIVTDDAIHQLNRQWRGKDKPTDVLSWPQSEADEPLSAYLGDVVISRDTAERQATARGWALEDELALLLVHGILHLLGHEDDTEEGSEQMKVIEREILGKPLDPL